MKKLLLILAFAGLLNVSAEEPRRHCYSTEQYKQDILSDPQYTQNQKDLEDFTRQFIKNAPVSRSSSGPVYIIPVVFHVLHNYGPENISDAQIIDAVNIMTRDFRKRNADTSLIIPIFQGIAADAEIEFRLATIDPNGNCTNGIEHIQTTKCYSADDNSKLNPWPCSKYMNIWTAYSLQNTAAAAYAKLPGGSNAVDGIMSRYDYVGSIGESSVNNSRTLTHEMGHCFNLLHPWGNTNAPGGACGGTDYVADTPESDGWDNCLLTGSVCNPPVIENVQNYMEYSYCDVMFTQGQVARMHATLNATANGRNNLWTPGNLIATGTDGNPPIICTPIADFQADNIAVCTGTAINFKDLSWKAPITSWNWSFPGGVPATSVDSNPVITYPTAGTFDASLIVTSSTGGDTIIRVAYIRVTDTALTTAPYTNDFELPAPASFPGVDGWIENSDNSTSALWTRVTTANSTTGGTASLKMNNFSNFVGQEDAWVTPSIDFSNVNFPVYLNFKVANAQRSATSNDQLKVIYSTNCGQSWSTAGFNKSGANLATAGVVTFNFTPSTPTQWRSETVNINPVQNKPNVRFKFLNISDRGNNTYVDDINITGNIVGIDQTDELQLGFTLYPNPSYGNTDLGFTLIKSGTVAIDVKNILGQSIATVLNKTLPAGDYNHKLPVLSPGIYLIDVTVNNKHHVRKLIVS